MELSNVSSVKNAGTSRVSYNKIFYANKPKTSLKNYAKASSKGSIPKKMIWRESNSSTQIRYLMKNKEMFLNSEHKMHKSSESPVEQNQNDHPDSNIAVLKNKLVKTISNNHIGQQINVKSDTKQIKNEWENRTYNNQEISWLEGKNDLTESDKSDSYSDEEETFRERSVQKKERKIRKMIKKWNKELFLASENGSLSFVKRLIFDTKSYCRPDINFRGPDFKTPLYTAASEGHYEIVEFLISNGAQIDIRTLWERNPLHIACIRGHTDILKLLISVAPDLINSVDWYGNTPAHYASRYGKGDTLSYLLKFNPKLYVKNLKNKTAIDVAYNSTIIDIFGDYVN